MRNISSVMLIFETFLQDEDSYLYLTAIQGFSTLADVLPDQTIPVIVAQYRFVFASPTVLSYDMNRHFESGPYMKRTKTCCLWLLNIVLTSGAAVAMPCWHWQDHAYSSAPTF
jgi:hypothetical protein